MKKIRIYALLMLFEIKRCKNVFRGTGKINKFNGILGIRYNGRINGIHKIWIQKLIYEYTQKNICI